MLSCIPGSLGACLLFQLLAFATATDARFPELSAFPAQEPVEELGTAGLSLVQRKASALSALEDSPSAPKAHAVIRDDPTNPSIFVAVFSRRDAFLVRSQIRGMWQNASNSPGLVTAKFALCFTEDGLASKLQEENTEHKDLMVMNCEEGYDKGRLTKKVLASMRVYHTHFNDHRMFFKVDDDAFVAWPRMAKFLVEYGSLNSYMGIPVGEARVCRNESYLWYEPYENYAEEMFPAGMAGGSGYILGRLLVGLILGTGLGEANILYNEDRSTALWIKKLMQSGAPVVWKEVPGIDGWWNWDYIHPQKSFTTWGEYKGILHHGLEGETIDCLGKAAFAGDDSKNISGCFATEVGKVHEPLLCAQLSATSLVGMPLAQPQFQRGSLFVELSPEI